MTRRTISGRGRGGLLHPAGLLALVFLFFVSGVFPQGQFEGRAIRNVTITFEGTDRNLAAVEEFRLIAREAVGDRYSTVKVREAIERLYNTREIADITVEAQDGAAGAVDLRFLIRRRTRAQRVAVNITDEENNNVTEQELLVRLDILEPGKAVTQATLENNASNILEYLRDRGYYQAEVRFSQRPLTNDAEVAVTFDVTPNAQATVESFDINVNGYDDAKLLDEIKLKPGEEYSRQALNDDIESIRGRLRKDDFLAPRLEEPRVVYDRDRNTISIVLTGSSGPVVNVEVEAGDEGVGGRTRRAILPVVREGTVDFAAIIEGERRLETHFQERGYFFANVKTVCAVEPPFDDPNGTRLKNDTEFLCSALASGDLQGKNVTIKYVADLDRHLTLKDIRLQGTDLFTIEEIQGTLESKEANILGIIPLFGYGRGYTSNNLLEQDATTIRTLLRELGYREANVRVNQGVSPDGESLIITFVVEQGRPSVITEAEIRGNTAFSDDELRRQLPLLVGRNYSRARVRTGQRQLAEFYSKAGYYYARVTQSFDNLGEDPATGNSRFRVIYNVENEGRRVHVARILITGNDKTKESAIRKALVVREGALLRSTEIYQSEQNLYATDVFAQVKIEPRAVGDRPDGGRDVDLLVTVEEQAPRILSYGGGISTDLGASGFVDIRHLNLLGNLWQGGARIRASRLQQLVQLDYVNPRFMRDGPNRFAPLNITASYQRDTTVTRFFRSAFDQGTFGIVQRRDAEGNPVDEFGNEVDDPTLNRLTVTAETNRTLSLRDRMIVFFRYRYEDVRLYNIESLLIQDLLEPDSRIRVSGFGATIVRDTRQNCNARNTVLEIIARGDVEDPCRYNAVDPTKGSYITAEYNFSAPFLGANIGFNKFQASVNKFYTFPRLKNTTLAGRAILGVGNVFRNGDRFDEATYPGLQGILPISERFFAGGANSLRGFDFESAGPRVVVFPEGQFFNDQGEQVPVTPFTVPFGGNALVVVNLEARIPITNAFRVVPFYDGGNVFRSIKDLFNSPDIPETDVFRRNLEAKWTHSVGLGLRLKTPIGGEAGVDYGFLLNPPSFIIPQQVGPPGIYTLPKGQLHFRFSQAF